MLIANLIKQRKRESKIESAMIATAVTDSTLMTRCAVTDRVSIASAQREVSLVPTRKTMADGSIKKPMAPKLRRNSNIRLSWSTQAISTCVTRVHLMSPSKF